MSNRPLCGPIDVKKCKGHPKMMLSQYATLGDAPKTRSQILLPMQDLQDFRKPKLARQNLKFAAHAQNEISGPSRQRYPAPCARKSPPLPAS
jgi:hypothetical protein